MPGCSGAECDPQAVRGQEPQVGPGSGEAGTGLHGAAAGGNETPGSRPRTSEGRGGRREPGTGEHSGHLTGWGQGNIVQDRGVGSGASLGCHPRRKGGDAAGPSPGSTTLAPALQPKPAGLSILAGSGPCPLSLQRGPRAPLVTQSSGSHCAPVTAQGNLGGHRGKRKTKGEDSGHSTEPQPRSTPDQEGTETPRG